MKRKFLTLAVLLGSTSVFAQTWLTNGNIITPANWLGSQNNQPLNFRTNNIQRIHIANGTAGINAGFVGIGNNFSAPANRLHLFQATGTFGTQYTSAATGSLATNGFAMNLVGSGLIAGEFHFRQFSNQNVRFIMPGSTLMELTWNIGPGGLGQVQMRPVFNPPLVALAGGLIYDDAQLSIGGAIGFSPGVTINNTNTLMYHNTSISGSTDDPTEDGFRVQYAFHSEGVNNGDCLVFEKTDGQSVFPDGCIKFTNYGNDETQRLSMTIEGNGHVGIGRPYDSFINPWRRLSVQDTLTQFRLQYLATNAISTEIYTDFYTDVNGNLLIDPRFSGNTNAGVVKINYGTGLVQPFPGLSLDVNGQANIRTVNPDNISTYVLVWDPTSGNVRYRDINTFPGGGGGGIVNAHNGATLSTISPNFVAFGQNFSQPGSPGALLSKREVPMNNFDIVFSDLGSTTYGNNEIGIGTTNPQAKLHIGLNSGIVEGGTTTGVRVDNLAISPAGKGIYTTLFNHTLTSYGYEVDIDANSNTTSINQGFRTSIIGGSSNEGVHAVVKNGILSNIGIYGQAVSTTSNANVSVGVHGESYDGVNRNIGGEFYARVLAGNTVNNYGVYAIAAGTSTNAYGIWAEISVPGPNAFAGFFNGNVHVQGDITASGTITPSDSQFKTNVNDFTGSMQIINQLQPRTFFYDTTGYAEFNFASSQQIGFIAQEVELIVPTIVTNRVRPAEYDTLGVEIAPEVAYKGLEYQEFIPILVGGIQEQQLIIDSMSTVNETQDSIITNLNDRLTYLENCLSALLPTLCEMNQSMIMQNNDSIQQALKSVITIELSDGNNVILNQNVPNPFAEQTTISFTIPSNVAFAQMLFYNEAGQLIKTVTITERGLGQINVFASDLSTGIYTYSLVIDGAIISSKKMVKTN